MDTSLRAIEYLQNDIRNLGEYEEIQNHIYDVITDLSRTIRRRIALHNKGNATIVVTPQEASKFSYYEIIGLFSIVLLYEIFQYINDTHDAIIRNIISLLIIISVVILKIDKPIMIKIACLGLCIGEIVAAFASLNKFHKDDIPEIISIASPFLILLCGEY